MAREKFLLLQSSEPERDPRGRSPLVTAYRAWQLGNELVKLWVRYNNLPYKEMNMAELGDHISVVKYPDFEYKEVVYADRDPSNVVAYGFHYDLQVMIVVFQRGKGKPVSLQTDAYLYFACPINLYQGLDEAESKGSFFQSTVKPFFSDPATYERVVGLTNPELVELLKDCLIATTPPLIAVQPAIEGTDTMDVIIEQLRKTRNMCAVLLPEGVNIEAQAENIQKLQRRLARAIATFRYYGIIAERPNHYEGLRLHHER